MKKLPYFDSLSGITDVSGRKYPNKHSTYAILSSSIFKQDTAYGHCVAAKYRQFRSPNRAHFGIGDDPMCCIDMAANCPQNWAESGNRDHSDSAVTTSRRKLEISR